MKYILIACAVIASMTVSLNASAECHTPGAYDAEEMMAEIEKNPRILNEKILRNIPNGFEIVSNTKKVFKSEKPSAAYTVPIKSNNAVLFGIICIFSCKYVVTSECIIRSKSGEEWIAFKEKPSYPFLYVPATDFSVQESKK